MARPSLSPGSSPNLSHVKRFRPTRLLQGRCVKVLWRKRGANAAYCCNLDTAAEILGEQYRLSTNLGVASAEVAGKTPDSRKSVCDQQPLSLLSGGPMATLQNAPRLNGRNRAAPPGAAPPSRPQAAQRALPALHLRSRLERGVVVVRRAGIGGRVHDRELPDRAPLIRALRPTGRPWHS